MAARQLPPPPFYTPPSSVSGEGRTAGDGMVGMTREDEEGEEARRLGCSVSFFKREASYCGLR